MRKKDFKKLLNNVTSNHSPDFKYYTHLLRDYYSFYLDVAYDVWSGLSSRIVPNKPKTWAYPIELVVGIITYYLLHSKFNYDIWTNLLIVVLIMSFLDFVIQGDFMDMVRTVFVLFMVDTRNEVGIKLFFGYQAIELSYYYEDVPYKKVRIRDIRKITSSDSSSKLYLVHGSKVHNVIFDFVASNTVPTMVQYADKSVEVYSKYLINQYYREKR